MNKLTILTILLFTGMTYLKGQQLPSYIKEKQVSQYGISFRELRISNKSSKEMFDIRDEIVALLNGVAVKELLSQYDNDRTNMVYQLPDSSILFYTYSIAYLFEKREDYLTWKEKDEFEFEKDTYMLPYSENTSDNIQVLMQNVGVSQISFSIGFVIELDAYLNSEAYSRVFNEKTPLRFQIEEGISTFFWLYFEEILKPGNIISIIRFNEEMQRMVILSNSNGIQSMVSLTDQLSKEYRKLYTGKPVNFKNLLKKLTKSGGELHSLIKS